MSRLSQYFTGVAFKRLSAVEANPQASNQHEFNGIKQMSTLFGTERTRIPCQYLYLGEDEEETASAEGLLTWYDAREQHLTRSEYRLYFQGNNVMGLASEGDLLVIGRRANGEALALVIKQGSTFERQVLWLFGILDENRGFSVNTIQGANNREIGYAERTIMETLGIETETADMVRWIDRLVAEFGNAFPTTRVFSEYARQTLPEMPIIDDPDTTILAWINHEEMLFRTFEKHLVQQKIAMPFTDVDDFITFSLSVHQRRKSRVGFALENHLEQIFKAHKIAFSRGQVTENDAKPDFIFPNIHYYRDPSFPASNLTMLGAKSTCKDRWRQVLSEADRISNKHLFTLEPGISENQTREMQDKNLQLVLPEGLHTTFLPEQQAWLMNLSEFIEMVFERELT